ncbi:MAG: MerR family transcriptional regulator [Lachnospiraceae bacterium]
MNNKNKLLSIGQFAALHGINKKTLMWYDETGLFHPAVVNPANNYRYYNYSQSPVLETILLLRELDVSVSEIKNFMKNRSAESMEHLLAGKIKELDSKITHLKAVRETLLMHHNNMLTLQTMDLSEIKIIQKKEHYLVTVDINENTSFEQEVEMVTAETEKYQLGRLHNANYGSMVSVASLKYGKFNDYSKLFIEIPYTRPEDGLHIQPGGRYLQAFHKGDWNLIPIRYKEILQYASRHGLGLYGFSYEMGINENVIDSIDDYIVQIEIPIAD